MTGAMTPAGEGSDNREVLVSLFRGQAEWCRRLGSEIYGFMLERAADDMQARGPVWRAVEPYCHRPFNFAHHLRLFGAAHRLALLGEVPELAAHYPSCGGDADAEAAWNAFVTLLESREIDLERPVQTNEVQRSAALLGGFLTVAERTGLGLRVLEIGASAGLNLRWDRFRYDAADWGFGDSGSPARIPCDYSGGRPPLPSNVWVVERAGCDMAPIDATSDDGSLWLQAFVWPDQLKRLELLRAAIDVARRTPATVEQKSAPDWVDEQLARERGGSATVLFHSIMWGYLTDDDRARITTTLQETGERATDSEPLAWLRLEPGGDQADLTLTSWPGGDEVVLAHAGYHGNPVEWLA